MRPHEVVPRDGVAQVHGHDFLADISRPKGDTSVACGSVFTHWWYVDAHRTVGLGPAMRYPSIADDTPSRCGHEGVM